MITRKQIYLALACGDEADAKNWASYDSPTDSIGVTQLVNSLERMLNADEMSTGDLHTLLGDYGYGPDSGEGDNVDRFNALLRLRVNY